MCPSFFGLLVYYSWVLGVVALEGDLVSKLYTFNFDSNCTNVHNRFIPFVYDMIVICRIIE